MSNHEIISALNEILEVLDQPLSAFETPYRKHSAERIQEQMESNRKVITIGIDSLYNPN